VPENGPIPPLNGTTKTRGNQKGKGEIEEEGRKLTRERRWLNKMRNKQDKGMLFWSWYQTCDVKYM